MVFTITFQDYTAFKSADATLADKKGSNRAVFYTRANVGYVRNIVTTYMGYPYALRVGFNDSVLVEADFLADFPDAILLVSVGVTF